MLDQKVFTSREISHYSAFVSRDALSTAAINQAGNAFAPSTSENLDETLGSFDEEVSNKSQLQTPSPHSKYKQFFNGNNPGNKKRKTTYRKINLSDDEQIYDSDNMTMRNELTEDQQCNEEDDSPSKPVLIRQNAVKRSSLVEKPVQKRVSVFSKEFSGLQSSRSQDQFESNDNDETGSISKSEVKKKSKKTHISELILANESVISGNEGLIQTIKRLLGPIEKLELVFKAQIFEDIVKESRAKPAIFVSSSSGIQIFLESSSFSKGLHRVASIAWRNLASIHLGPMASWVLIHECSSASFRGIIKQRALRCSAATMDNEETSDQMSTGWSTSEQGSEVSSGCIALETMLKKARSHQLFLGRGNDFPRQLIISLL
ncbi:hypothetical protein Ciccas_008113, partial [Cichlidogyrus casuarinus]